MFFLWKIQWNYHLHNNVRWSLAGAVRLERKCVSKFTVSWFEMSMTMHTRTVLVFCFSLFELSLSHFGFGTVFAYGRRQTPDLERLQMMRAETSNAFTLYWLPQIQPLPLHWNAYTHMLATNIRSSTHTHTRQRQRRRWRERDGYKIHLNAYPVSANAFSIVCFVSSG